jgi:Beta-galactosidase
MRTNLWVVAAVAVAAACLGGCAGQTIDRYAQWSNGPSGDADYFPVAVWLQTAENAPKYQALGINVYIGQWKGPTEEQLAELTKHGMKVICAQNEVGLAHKDDPIIIGWMHGDEPDNCKRNPDDTKWIPVAHPEETIADYTLWKERDPSRPVYLNLGMGVAFDPYVGKWVRDHSKYIKFLEGCDIVSYDIYPMRATKKNQHGRNEHVPFGVDRLHKWSDGKTIVWNIVETIPLPEGKSGPTPHSMRNQVWASLIHGSTGICYFVHQFRPEFIEAGVLAYPEMAKAVGEINAQIHELAPALNSSTVDGLVAATSYNADRTSLDSEIPVDIMVKRQGGYVYVLAAAMRGGKEAKVTFHVRPTDAAVPQAGPVEVLGENRSVEMADGVFADQFGSYDVHLYRFPLSK